MQRVEIAKDVLCALLTEPEWEGGQWGVYAQLTPQPNEDAPTETMVQRLVRASYIITDELLKQQFCSTAEPFVWPEPATGPDLPVTGEE